ncbi:MAG TPA: ABC transporter permease [Chthoniobacterales bacterium]|nr:ABC transporter permease [Chthoniobacterales bacterium]
MFTDLKYALRMLLKSPGFAIIAVLTLALGIGANSAIFSVVDAVLLRPMPFQKPNEIVMVWGRSVRENAEHQSDSYPNYVDLRERSQTLDSLAAYTRAGAVLQGANESELLGGLAVTSDVFRVLRVWPMLGRSYTREEDKVSGPGVVVLSYGLWQRAFAGDPSIVGKQINLSGRSHTVLGVMPRGFKFPVQDPHIDYYMPLESLVATYVPRRDAHFLSLVGRLKSDVTARQAEAELNGIATQLERQYPDSNSGQSEQVVPLHREVVGNVRPALLILVGAVTLVLLIACGNVANLLLARAAGRSREIAIRTALGASRMQLLRQLLGESLLLSILGGSGGLVLASWGIDVLQILRPQNLPRADQIGINLVVCAFTFSAAIVSTFIFGLFPAVQLTRSEVGEALQHGSKGISGSERAGRVRSLLIISQVAFSVLLLASAGLLIRSFYNLRATNPGFDPVNLAMMDFVVPRVSYAEPEKQIAFYRDLLPKLRALPGVQMVGGADPAPFSNNDSTRAFTIAGQPPVPKGQRPGAGYLSVDSDYFRAMKIPLKQGRVFDSRDSKDGAHTVMVNEAFAKQFLNGGSAVGRRIIFEGDDDKPNPCEIVGVVGNAHHDEVGTPVEPEMYVPFEQDPSRRMFLMFRLQNARLTGIEHMVRDIVHQIDSQLYVPEMKPMENLLAEHIAQPRFNMLLLSLFAAVAMTLAAIGIYGVIAYSVAQRTKEIGIRMALGAQRIDMLTMILRQSFTVIGVGLLIGLVGGLGVTRLMSSLLYGVSPTDLSIYVIVIVLLSGAALIATYFPARRAMQVDPMVALRYE